MKQLKIGLVGLIGILAIIIVSIWIFIIFILPSMFGYVPRKVEGKEKEELKNMTLEYLNKKYGEHNFKITEMEDVRHSKLSGNDNIGFRVSFKCDVLDSSTVYVEGFDLHNNCKFKDILLEDYFFGNYEPAEKFRAMNETMVPKEKIESFVLKKVQKEFDSEIQSVEVLWPKYTIPDDFGRIPSLDEAKNDISMYKADTLFFEISYDVKDKEEFKRKFSQYLEEIYGEEWSVNVYNDGKIKCTGPYTYICR